MSQKKKLSCDRLSSWWAHDPSCIKTASTVERAATFKATIWNLHGSHSIQWNSADGLASKSKNCCNKKKDLPSLQTSLRVKSLLWCELQFWHFDLTALNFRNKPDPELVLWFPSLQLQGQIVNITYEWRLDCNVSHVFLSPSVDLHSWPGGVPGLHQPPFEGEAAEASRAAGTTGRQPQGHRPPPDQLQTEHHSSGQILPGEGPYCHGKLCGRLTW